MGNLMTFIAARVNDEAAPINEIQIAFRSAVTPGLRLALPSVDPTSTTKTDNSRYSLADADVSRVRCAPVNQTGVTLSSASDVQVRICGAGA